jgi:hypothetical protein
MIGKTFISLKIELLCVENYCPQDKRWGDFEHPTGGVGIYGRHRGQ